MLSAGSLFCLSLAASLVHGVVITKTNTAVVCPTEIWNRTTGACTTQLGLTSLTSVPTAVLTTTRELPPIVVLSTSVSVMSVTLNASTHVDTSTVTLGTNTTATALTNTVLSTSSVFVTSTVLETSTLTSTVVSSTTVTTTSTSTIPTASGFLPIEDTTSSIYPAPVPSFVKRDISLPQNLTLNHGNLTLDHGHHGVIGDLYAVSVTCVTIVDVRITKTIIVPGSTSITTVTPPVVSATLFTTVTSTSTFTPQNASTTLDLTTTISATTTVTLTTSTTVTLTSTFYATETATTYAACSASNLIGPQTSDGRYIDAISIRGGSLQFSFAQATDNAYDCCVACIDSAACGGTAYSSSMGCVLLLSQQNVCASQGAYSAVYTVGESASGFTVSNGMCGFLYRDSSPM